MNKTAPFPTAPREGATTNVRAAGPSLPGRILLALANSRELMLLALIAILVVGMTVVYPNNFPTSFNISAVLLNAAQNGILVAGMMLLMIAGSFDLSVGSTLALAGVWAESWSAGGVGPPRSALWRLCLSAESRVPSTAPSSRGSALTR